MKSRIFSVKTRWMWGAIALIPFFWTSDVGTDEAVGFPASTDVIILNSGTIVPPAPTRSLRLEIDLSRRQLTLYEGEQQIKSIPVAVGREGWRTPVGEFRVMEMIHNPAWQNPFTGSVIPGGDPENPLGNHWIGFWTDGTNWVGMHGTPNPDSVGRAASHGCIRLYNEDIQQLFSMVTVGTPVVVVP